MKKFWKNFSIASQKAKEGIMQSSIKEEKGLKRKLEFAVSAQEVENCFLKNYQKIQKSAKMPGFRQGKVPLNTLKQTYKGHAHEAVMDDLFRSFYPKALKENEIHPAGPPTLLNLDLQEGKACKFLLEVEVHPQVKVENYMNLELKKINISIKEEEVSEALERLRQSCAKFEDSLNKSPVKKGDFFVINMEGFLASKNQKKLNYPNLLLQAGEDMVAPGFDDLLIGLNLEEEKEFDFEFPKNHPNFEIAGLNLNIKVRLIGFKNKQLPELSDELAKQFKLETLEELKAKIKKDLKVNLEQKAKEEMENNVVQQLVEKNPVELPEVLIKDQKQKLKDNAIKRLQEYKMPEAEQEVFLREKDTVFEKEAKESLHISYLMKQLIQNLKIKTTEEDIQKALQESFPKKKPEDMEKELKKGKYWDNFIFNLTRRQVIAYLIEKARFF